MYTQLCATIKNKSFKNNWKAHIEGGESVIKVCNDPLLYEISLWKYEREEKPKEFFIIFF